MKSICEYVWLGGNNELRSKARVLDLNAEIELLKQIPDWNYDGSSTGQANGSDSEVIIKPCAVFRDPFRDSFRDPFREYSDFLVMCDTYKPDGTPLENNYRPAAIKIFNQNLEEVPWFGIEQEYFLIDSDTNLPLGFPKNGYPRSQGPYYCAVGQGNVFGRDVANDHLKACLVAGVQICGLNGEVAPGQWEYQIGPCIGIESGDHVWMSRYILERIAEKYYYKVCWHPKPVLGDWNGSGCHTNYSTKSMREGIMNDNKTGLDVINEAIYKLSEKHAEHIAVYGTGNELRMTGEHETSHIDKFSYGIADRGASVRIGNETVKNKQGYFEDRRPSSNMNPYLVTAKLFETTVLC